MTDIKPDVVVTDLPSPAPDNPLEALSWLGDTVEEVAEGLRARGIKGRISAHNACPLAVYLHNWWPEAWVGYERCAQSLHANNTLQPAPILGFRKAFDRRQFHDLIDSDG